MNLSLIFVEFVYILPQINIFFCHFSFLWNKIIYDKQSTGGNAKEDSSSSEEDKSSGSNEEGLWSSPFNFLVCVYILAIINIFSAIVYSESEIPKKKIQFTGGNAKEDSSSSKEDKSSESTKKGL